MPSECTAKPLQRELADSIIRLAHPDDIRILIACGAKVNEVVTQGLRPIHYAVWKRNAEALHLLLVRGCDVNSLDDCGYSALHLAAEHGYTEMMRILLATGAKTEYRDKMEDGILYPRTTLSEEPLRLAIKNNHYAAARILLEHGANPNARYFFGSEINLLTPADLPFLELLLMFGADPNSRDRQGLTPLMRACRYPDSLQTILCLIAYGADINAVTDERHDYRTVLHHAVLCGDLDLLQLLIKQGAHVNYSAEYEKPTPLDLAILRGDVECVKLLIMAGANVNASCPVIGTPLHVAAAENIPNRYTIMRILLENGADPNQVVISDDGMPLKAVLGEYLTSNVRPEPKIIKLLMKYGAKVILKSQFRDPLGILNCLENVAANDELLEEILQSAESFDRPMIRRSSALSEEQKEIALSMSVTPMSLKHQTRLFLRKYLGNGLPAVAHALEIPKILTHYLLFQVS